MALALIITGFIKVEELGKEMRALIIVGIVPFLSLAWIVHFLFE